MVQAPHTSAVLSLDHQSDDAPHSDTPARSAGVHIANFHISNLFPKVKRTVIASFSAVFGGGGVVFLLFGLLHSDPPGWSISDLFYSYGGVIGLLSVAQQLLVQQARVFPVGAHLEFQCCFPPGFVVVEPGVGATPKAAGAAGESAAAAHKAAEPLALKGIDEIPGSGVVIHVGEAS